VDDIRPAYAAVKVIENALARYRDQREVLPRKGSSLMQMHYFYDQNSMLTCTDEPVRSPQRLGVRLFLCAWQGLWAGARLYESP